RAFADGELPGLQCVGDILELRDGDLAHGLSSCARQTPRPNSPRKSASTLSRVRVCQRVRWPIGTFSTSATTLRATQTVPGWASMAAILASNEVRSPKANAPG